MTVVRAAALGACVLALCACDSGAGRKGPTKVVARGSAAGKHVSATASYDFTVLSDLSIHVEAVPAQRVTGGWWSRAQGRTRPATPRTSRAAPRSTSR